MGSFVGKMKVDWDANAALRASKRGSARGLAAAAEFVLGESRRVVPHDEGELERSGFTDADDEGAVIGYDTPYARRQHEEMGYRHKAGRKAKYLEQPLRENQKKVADILRREAAGEF